MTILRDIVLLLYHTVLFAIAIVIAGLSAHFGGDLIAAAFGIDQLIPSAVIFFAVAALLEWIGDRIWPEPWLSNIWFWFY